MPLDVYRSSSNICLLIISLLEGRKYPRIIVSLYLVPGTVVIPSLLPGECVWLAWSATSAALVVIQTIMTPMYQDPALLAQ